MFFLMLFYLLLGFFLIYVKLYLMMKFYEYGFRVFVLTYCFVMVFGYSMGDFIYMVVMWFFLIVFGVGVFLVVNVCIYLIWVGEDLYNLVVKNFMSVVNFLEGYSMYLMFFNLCILFEFEINGIFMFVFFYVWLGCVKGYFNCVEYESVFFSILIY